MGTLLPFVPRSQAVSVSAPDLVLDCRDTLQAVRWRARVLMECDLAFTCEAEMLVKEIRFFVRAAERLRAQCVVPEMRRQLEVMKTRAWALRLAVSALHHALVHTDSRARMRADAAFGEEFAKFAREALVLFPLKLIPPGESRV